MLRSLGIALLCLAALAPIRVEAEAPMIVVQPGDALSSIAQRAGVSVSQIKKWNRLDGDLIRIGQRLVIAPPSSTRPTQARSRDDGIDWTPPFDYPSEPPARREPPIAARDPRSAVATRLSEESDSKKGRARI